MKDFLVTVDINVRQAMKRLDQTAGKCLLVVDEQNRFLGTVSDGDVRRGILNGAQFSDDLSTIYHNKPTFLRQSEYSVAKAKQLLREKKINLIPIVDDDQHVVDYVTWDHLSDVKRETKQIGNVPVIIMAGGKGSRLEPFTTILPKPLIPVHDKPILEHIIERFTALGCADFYLTVNYKSKILKAYFQELEPSYAVHFLEETKPLGTAGSLRFVHNKFDHPFFVTNCDIIIKSDYASLYKFHLEGGYDISLVASAKEYVIPYGTCELNSEGHLSHINEKPTYEFLINTGLYVLNPDVLDLIPKDRFYHITHLIEDAKNQGKKVGVYPIDEDAWIDIGQWAEYRRAVELL